MTTAWGLILFVLELILDFMEDTTIFYGISIWDLFLLFLVIIDIRFILSGIFGGGDDDASAD
jgi:hypothetical protein